MTHLMVRDSGYSNIEVFKNSGNGEPNLRLGYVDVYFWN